MTTISPLSTDWFWTEVGLLCERWDARQHPYHQRWSAGLLGPADLQLYAAEYQHVVVAIAQAATAAARLSEGPVAARLERYAERRRHRVDSWMAFARATGWCSGSAWYFAEDPFEETLACARMWSGRPRTTLAEHLVTLYAVESGERDTSEAQLEALLTHYGFDTGRSTEYFLHYAGDGINLPALAREAFEACVEREDPFRLLGQVEAVSRAGWGMLDRLEMECPSS